MLKRGLRRSDLPVAVGGGGAEEMTRFAGEVRDVYRRFLVELEERHRAGASGMEVARARSDAVETIVQHLYESLRDWMDEKPGVEPALVALGGFGRRELSPYSDVDVLFLWGRRGGKEAGIFAGYLVRLMWDSGLKLGHSVRTLAELEKAMRIDLDLGTSILDGRWICGDESLKTKLAGIKGAVRERESGNLLVAKLDEARRRWKKYGWSYHLVEPNVKESPGGLRDFQTIRWIGMVLPWAGTLEGLYRLSIIDRTEIKEIQRAFDFLVRARNELHFATQGDSNVLTVELQQSVSAGLRYRRAGEMLAVEAFMQDYYSRTRSIYRVLERILEETHGRGSLRIIDGALYKRVGTRGLGRLELQLRREKLRRDPLFMFKELQRTGDRFSPRMEKRIKKEFSRLELDAETAKRMRASFLELLRMPGGKAHVIRSMHELGVLRHLFPDFEKLTCLKRYELYHQYTADEHSLQAIDHLERLGESDDGLLSRIYSEVDEKMELYLSTLLHDIGKVKTKGHAEAGAVMTARLLRGFPLSQRSRAIVTFLIRNHLLLSHFSQRRDMEDLDTSLQFVKRVKNHLNLKLLYLLTYADLRATGTGVWTGWKENLLEDLYYKASRLLAEESELGRDFTKILEERRGRILAACATDAERMAMTRHLETLPGRYSMVVSPARSKMHLDMIGRLQHKLAVFEIKRMRHSLELTICTRDRPFRLSQLCGVITINDLNILGAYAFTRGDGTVIDIFHVIGIEGELSFPRAKWADLSRDLNVVLGGKLDLERATAAHIAKWKRTVSKGPPAAVGVEFENDLSGDFTIIDITAGDMPGLLYRITHILSDEGLDIHSAQITTRGRTIADSFYVQQHGGGKISDSKRMRRIRRRLTAALAGSK